MMRAVRMGCVSMVTFCCAMLMPQTALGTGQIYIDPPVTYIEICQNSPCTPGEPDDPCVLQVDVAIDDALLGLTGFDFHIEYDDDVVTLMDIEEGPLPGSGGAQTFFYWAPDGGGLYASVLISGAVLGSSVDGPGVLATLTFYPLATGVSPVAFRDDLLLRDLENAEIPAVVVHGSIEIDCAVPVEETGWGTVKSLFR